MAGQVEICNLALTEIGAATITAFDASDTSKEADLCRTLYALLRDEVLKSHKWDFAKKWVALALDADYTMVDEEYDYAYQLPADYARMSRTETHGDQYEVRGSVLVSNTEDLIIEYIFKEEDATKYPQHFIDAFVARLRASLSVPLAQKGSKSVDWMGLYRVILKSAKTSDAQQGNPSYESKQGHTSTNDTWLASR